MTRRAAAVTLLVAGFVLAALVYVTPLAGHYHDAFLYPTVDPHPLALGDSALTAWMLAWSGHALRTTPWRLFEANIFHPVPSALAFSEHMVGAAVLVLPLQLFGTDPVRDQNVLLVLTLVLGGLGTVWLVRELGGSWQAATVAGVLFSFGPWRLLYLGHVQVLACHGMPITLAFLHRLLRTGRWGDAIGFAVAFALQALTSMYHAYYFGVAVVLFVAVHWLLGLPAAPGARRRVVLVGAAAGLLLAPTFLPYVAARDRFALGRSPFQAFLFSAVGDTFLGALRTPMTFLTERYGGAGTSPTVVGLGTLGLAALALIGGAGQPRGERRVAWLYGLLAAFTAVLSLGPLMRMSNATLTLDLASTVPGPYAVLTAIVPGMDALRVPARMALTTYLALAVLAGLGVDALLRRLRGRVTRGVVTVGLTALTLAEVWRPTLHAHEIDWLDETAGAYAWLAAQPGEFPILELPISHLVWDVRYMVLSAHHWKRLVNGRSSFPLTGPYLRRAFATFPDPPSHELLHRLGVRYTLVHDDWMPRPRCAELVARREPWLVLRWHDERACLFEIVGTPPTSPRPPERDVPSNDVTVQTSGGDDASAVLDGDLQTHWVQAVDGRRESWLEIVLPEPRALTGITLHLGRHFGDHLRLGRIDGSLDGKTWTPLVATQLFEPPLADLAVRPDDLRVDIPLPGRMMRALRLVRVAATPQWREVFADWARWGAHEITFREAAPVS